MILVGDGVSVMAARFPARSRPGAIKMSGRVCTKWKHKNADYRRIDKYIAVNSHNVIFTCNE